jgi:hypothetical protein
MKGKGNNIPWWGLAIIAVGIIGRAFYPQLVREHAAQAPGADSPVRVHVEMPAPIQPPSLSQ